ncbi:MAG: hypothetical protein RLZ10_2556 [Bacteroidota bacterium]|jgi:hypothetical protein
MNISNEQLQLLINHHGYGIGKENSGKVKTLIIGNESGTGDALNSEEFIKGLEVKCFEKTQSGNYFTKSDFLQFIGRIVRALEKREGKWFAPKDSWNVWNEIISGEYYSDSAHLFDIRPLPRTTENESWPYENIDKKSY